MGMAQQRAKDPHGSGARPRLSARDWADAALAAMGEGGLAAVAVEPLAARLGTTKGSFYWHFSNRDALIEAALERWEETGTEAVITELEAEPDPGRRLRRLLTQAISRAATDPLELSLLASTTDPRVAAALARVTDRRIGYVAALFAALGFPEGEARHRGLLAYTAYLGHAQLGHAVPHTLPAEAAQGSYLDGVIDTLVRPRNGGDETEHVAI
ncbi:TetR/AcrR family transcriptional regulator [Streptomyces sp. bgisy084]|uniref:TetR/AcrR family transcriptional regulator n=1 Tax=Streptomyces sp. bgisy084 TaxID=3413777 RepID=UPI003D764873